MTRLARRILDAIDHRLADRLTRAGLFVMTHDEHATLQQECAEWQVRAAESSALRAEVEVLRGQVLDAMRAHRDSLAEVVLGQTEGRTQ